MVDLPKIIEALKEIRLKDYKITEAEVITVTPLSSEQKNRAVKTLKKISGTDMILTEKINPSILGGLIFKLNDSIVDASLIRKIREMNKLLTA